MFFTFPHAAATGILHGRPLKLASVRVTITRTCFVPTNKAASHILLHDRYAYVDGSNVEPTILQAHVEHPFETRVVIFGETRPWNSSYHLYRLSASSCDPGAMRREAARRATCAPSRGRQRPATRDAKRRVRSISSVRMHHCISSPHCSQPSQARQPGVRTVPHGLQFKQRPSRGPSQPVPRVPAKIKRQGYLRFARCCNCCSPRLVLVWAVPRSPRWLGAAWGRCHRASEPMASCGCNKGGSTFGRSTKSYLRWGTVGDAPSSRAESISVVCCVRTSP